MNLNIKNEEFHNILLWASMGIGNTVNFIPLLLNLRANFPKAKITLLCSANKGNYQLLDSNLYDKLIYFNKGSRVEKYTAYARVLFGNFDLFIVKWHRNPIIAIFLKLAWKSKVIGHVSGGGWLSPYDYLADIKIPMEDGIHDVYQYLNLLKPLGIKNPITEQKINIKTPAKIKIENLFKSYNLNDGHILIGLHLDAGHVQPYKNLDSKIWIDVLRNLEVKYPSALFFLIGGAESEIANEVFRSLKKSLVFYDFMGMFSLQEVSSFISRLDILIAVDSSLKTIADAVGTSSVIASGATNYVRSQPIQAISKIVRLDLDCSPCDIFGPTKWDECSHRSCIYNLDSSLLVNAVNHLLDNKNKIRIKEIKN